ncbi:minor tail protein [Microbacterium phage Katzastrophic]|uniref:minor tail protein n=1 Tax=Microbacterium phage Katzastrophic TaxID=2912654 RepID=UPI00242D2FB6|nr:minor tail protein [Microbacterium phage Katzastrophic]UKH48456.1 minor tail protein [Microbacterium phage Katzastrophic]
MVSSNFPSRPFRLEEGVYVWGQNAWNTGNNTLLHSELWIRKNSYSPTWTSSGASYEMYVNGTRVGANGNFGFDFRNSDQLLIHSSDNWFGNDGEGHMYVTIDGYCNGAILGYTEVHSGFWAPRIAQPAAAPTPIGLDEITTNSMRYRFSGNDLRGAAWVNWEFQVSDNPSFTGWAPIYGSSGTSTVTGLTPGKTYYFRSRAQTNAGAGAWSGVISAKTLAAVYWSDGSSWRPVEVYWSNGSQWLPVEVLYSRSSAWVSPLSI